jgi:hypothetical protein
MKEKYILKLWYREYNKQEYKQKVRENDKTFNNDEQIEEKRFSSNKNLWNFDRKPNEPIKISQINIQKDPLNVLKDNLKNIQGNDNKSNNNMQSLHMLINNDCSLNMSNTRMFIPQPSTKQNIFYQVSHQQPYKFLNQPFDITSKEKLKEENIPSMKYDSFQDLYQYSKQQTHRRSVSSMDLSSGFRTSL